MENQNNQQKVTKIEINQSNQSVKSNSNNFLTDKLGLANKLHPVKNTHVKKIIFIIIINLLNIIFHL